MNQSFVVINIIYSLNRRLLCHTLACRKQQRESESPQHEMQWQALRGAYSDLKLLRKAWSSVVVHDGEHPLAILYSLPCHLFDLIKMVYNKFHYYIQIYVWHHKLINFMKGTRKYLRNTNESPATNLLEVTKVLHPVVSKCLRGWPGVLYTDSAIEVISYLYIYNRYNTTL